MNTERYTVKLSIVYFSFKRLLIEDCDITLALYFLLLSVMLLVINR